MKRFQIVLIVIPLLYWAGCGDDENEDNEGNPVISGRTIYIVGSDGGGACYWVNGSRVELSGGAWATDIVVVDGTVYISGQADITTTYEACYWINQEIHELPGNGGEAEAIAVDGDDVYVAGWFNNGSCYWKNGERINLTTNAESQAFAIGVDRIVLGSVSLKNPLTVQEAVARHGTHRIIVGLDARNGLIALEGWKEQSLVKVEELMKQMITLGVTRFIYTDIARDGTLLEPNFDAIRLIVRKAQSLESTVIASGGVSCLAHIKQLSKIGAEGVILGTGLYSGAFKLGDALNEINRIFFTP